MILAPTLFATFKEIRDELRSLGRVQQRPEFKFRAS